MWRQLLGKEKRTADNWHIWAESGKTKIMFTGKNGRDHELSEAKGVLEVGHIYTVAKIEVGDWSSEVWLHEVDDLSFNTVHFKLVEEDGIDRAISRVKHGVG